MTSPPKAPLSGWFLLALLVGGVLYLSDPLSKVTGILFAPQGGIRFTGMGGVFRCGAVGNTIRVLGGQPVVVNEGCLLN